MPRPCVSLLAAGIAFYAMLAIFPAIIALVTIYGMVADPAQVESQVGGFAKSLPSGADQLLTEQLKNVVNAGRSRCRSGWRSASWPCSGASPAASRDWSRP